MSVSNNVSEDLVKGWKKVEYLRSEEAEFNSNYIYLFLNNPEIIAIFRN